MYFVSPYVQLQTVTCSAFSLWTLVFFHSDLENNLELMGQITLCIPVVFFFTILKDECQTFFC